MFSFLKRNKIGVIVVLVAVVIIISFLKAGAKNNTETVSPVIGDLVTAVRVSGKVIPSQSVDLAFEKGGIVSKVLKMSGDSVVAGETIAMLDQSSIYAGYLRAQADLEAAKAELAKISSDTGPFTKTDNAKYSVVQEIMDAYTQADDAVHNKIDQFFSNPRSPNPQIIRAFDDKDNLESSINSQRLVMEEMLNTWKIANAKLTIATYTSSDLEKAKKNLSSLSAFLNDVARAVNDFEPNSALSQTSIDKYRSDTATARANSNSAIASLIAAEDKWRESVSDIPVQNARVLSAQADVASYRADLDKTLLKAPFAGVISKQDAKAGESVSANSVVSSVISTNYEIETYVPEVSIAGVLVGNSADITLDAYGSSVPFTAQVIHIDPAETIRDGVSTYKVNLVFNSPDARIKSGMTTNITIETMRKSGTLLIPKRAIVEKDGQKIVMVKTDSKDAREQVIETGMSDSKGNVEVISGVTENDLLLLNPAE